MKFGFLRKDDDGHWFVIPEALINDFDDHAKMLENIQVGENFSEEDWYDAYRDWEDAWSEYMEGGSITHYKVVLEE